MIQRPQIYLYSTLAAGLAAMTCLSIRSQMSRRKLAEIDRTTRTMQSQIEDIHSSLRAERSRLDDLINWIQPLRDYSKNRVKLL